MIYSNEKVRRQDRLLDEEQALELLRRGEYGVLSMVDPAGGGYGVPLNYVWDEDAEVVYIHCAPDGEKLRSIAINPQVTFCIVGATQLFPAQFSTAYESVLLRCRAEIGLSPEERMWALQLLLRKYAPDDYEIGMKYAQKSFSRTEIIRLRILSASGKCKRAVVRS